MHNIRPKTAETSAIRVSKKITKTVSRHAEVQISGRFDPLPAVFKRQREKKGDQFKFKRRKMVNYYAIRSMVPTTSR